MLLRVWGADLSILAHVSVLYIPFRYKRQEEEREIAKKKKEKEKAVEGKKDAGIEAWLEGWAAKEAARAAEVAAHLTRIWNDADTKEERAERKQLLKEIKVRRMPPQRAHTFKQQRLACTVTCFHAPACVTRVRQVQAKDVLARAKVAGLRMEDPEAEQVAAKEVIAMHAHDAKKDVARDMRLAAAAAQSEEEEAKEADAK
jgi:hypothetical protein